jgi:hypothetical protein
MLFTGRRTERQSSTSCLVETYAAVVAVVVAVVGLVRVNAVRIRIFAQELYITVLSEQQERLAGLALLARLARREAMLLLPSVNA